MARPTSERLGERLQLLEEAAFLDFQYTYRRLFLTHFLRSGIPDVHAQDLTVDCLTDISLKAQLWNKEKGTFDSWVIALMRNAAVDWHRRNHDPTTQLQDGVDYVVPPKAEPDRANRASVAELHTRLAQLSAADRLVLELRYLGAERSFEEIGVELTASNNGKQVSANSARQRHSRALDRLRKLYGLIKGD